MKNLKYFALLLFVCICFQGFASEEFEHIKPGTAYIADNGIFVNLGGDQIDVEYLAVDSNCIYILEDKLPRKMRSQCKEC